jgi:hypothetical protein
MKSFIDILYQNDYLAQTYRRPRGMYRGLSKLDALKLSDKYKKTDWSKVANNAHLLNHNKSLGVLHEQKYSNLNRNYYHISDKLFKTVRTFGSGSVKLVFFALDANFCLEFSKLRFPGSNTKLYLYKCHLKSPLNICNINQKSSVDKLFSGSPNIINLYNQIQDKKNHRLLWNFLEEPEVVNKIARMNCYDGIAIDFFFGKEEIKTMGLALFNSNKINIYEFAEIDKDYSTINSIEWKSISEEKF